MKTLDTIRQRRTIHLYEDRPLPEGLLREALEACLRAPNHKLTNPWRFTRVGPETRAKLVDLGVELKGELSERTEAKVRDKLGSSAELVVVSQVRVADDFRRREDFGAIACAIQNLSLALWSEGVGSKWSTGGLTRHERTYELLGIDPEAEEIVGFVWIGYPRTVPDPPRRALDEVYRELP